MAGEVRGRANIPALAAQPPAPAPAAAQRAPSGSGAEPSGASGREFGTAWESSSVPEEVGEHHSMGGGSRDAQLTSGSPKFQIPPLPLRGQKASETVTLQQNQALCSAGSSSVRAGRGILLLCCSPRTAEGAGLAGIYRGRGAAGASAEQTAPSIPRPELPGTKGTFTHGQRGQRATQALPPRPPVAGTELGGHSDRSQGTRGGLGATSPWAGRDTVGTGQPLVRCRGAGSEDFPVPAFLCTPFPHRAGLCRPCPCPKTPILLLSA